MDQEDSPHIICNTILRKGGVAVIPTDTIYGIVCSALNSISVERLYTLKRRNTNKPCIILISKIEDLMLFDIEIKQKIATLLKKIWPSKTSVVFPCNSHRFFYLHRGTFSLAFRLPDDESLLSILRGVGPLLAPSANPEGMSPAINISDAQIYFGALVDYYLDSPKKIPPTSTHSTLISMSANGSIALLRAGAVEIDKLIL
jgi:L-threonylcarbamoyladenylate synthase